MLYFIHTKSKDQTLLKMSPDEYAEYDKSTMIGIPFIRAAGICVPLQQHLASEYYFSIEWVKNENVHTSHCYQNKLPWYNTRYSLFYSHKGLPPARIVV
jgi:hypothetical protein